MGYVKISDPNIIDLNAMHNIINVVNQHSDTLNTLTNNVGQANATPQTYTGNEIDVLFDSSSQMIIYGRAQFTSADDHITYKTTGRIYHQQVNFSNDTKGIPSFTTSSPIILVSIHTANSADVSSTFADATANVYSPSASSFKIRLVMAEAIGANQTVYVNWVALGPKNK
jgi:hypothetical protein